MVPIALTDSLWWVARRMRQLLTGLAMLALAFGAGSAYASPVGPPAILEARPATPVTFESGATPAAAAEFWSSGSPSTTSTASPAPVPAAPTRLMPIGAVVSTGSPAADDGSAAEGFPAYPATGPLAADQPRPAPGATTAARSAPAVGGSTSPVGQRAPPLR